MITIMINKYRKLACYCTYLRNNNFKAKGNGIRDKSS